MVVCSERLVCRTRRCKIKCLHSAGSGSRENDCNHACTAVAIRTYFLLFKVKLCDVVASSAATEWTCREQCVLLVGFCIGLVQKVQCMLLDKGRDTALKTIALWAQKQCLHVRFNRPDAGKLNDQSRYHG